MAELLQSDERRLAVAAALRDLERRLDRLATALAHAKSSAVEVEGAGTRGIAMQRVIGAYTAIDLEMDDAPSTSVVCLGIVGVPQSIVDLAIRVNDAKAALKAVCAPLQNLRIRVPDGDGTKVLPLIRAILRSLQRSELNLLAAYRRIPVLEQAPRRIAYTRARTRSVYRKSVGDVATMLLHSDSPRAATDRARLAALPSSERFVALVRDHYENVRANIVYDAKGRAPARRVQMPAELPLMYPLRRGAPLPGVSFPVPRPGDAPIRPRRSRLEARPFLETVAVHRYRPEFR